MRVKLAYGREQLWLDFPDGTPVDVQHALQSVRDYRPDAYAGWVDKDGRLRSSLNVFVNGEHIRYRRGLETELKDGDEVYVIPLVAGG